MKEPASGSAAVYTVCVVVGPYKQSALPLQVGEFPDVGISFSMLIKLNKDQQFAAFL